MKNNRDNKERNLRILAENAGWEDGFDIYLVFSSGRKEYLFHHRHNGLLFNALKDGLRVDEARHWKPFQAGSFYAKRTRTKLYKMITYLITVVDDYMLAREAG